MNNDNAQLLCSNNFALKHRREGTGSLTSVTEEDRKKLTPARRTNEIQRYIDSGKGRKKSPQKRQIIINLHSSSKRDSKRRKKSPKKKQVSINSYIPNKRLLKKIQQIQGFSQAIDEETFNQLPMNIRSELTHAAQRSESHKNSINGSGSNVINNCTKNSAPNNNNHMPYLRDDKKKQPHVDNIAGDTATTSTANSSEETNLIKGLGYDELIHIVISKQWDLSCRIKLKEYLERFSSATEVNSEGTEGICLCSLIFICQRKLKLLQLMIKYFINLCNTNKIYGSTWRSRMPFVVSCVQNMMKIKCGGTLRLLYK